MKWRRRLRRPGRWSLGLPGVAFVCFSASALGHECAFTSFTVFPRSGQPLPLNGRIVIIDEGLGSESELHFDLERMELRSEGEQIPLKVVETRLDRAAVTLVPEGPLRPATWYQLAGRDGKPVVRGMAGRVRAWLTSGSADHVPPRWRSAPSLASSTVETLGRWVQVSVPIEGDEPVGVDVEMGPVGAPMPIGSAAPVRHFFNVDKGVVALGAGLCGGLYPMRSWPRYWVKLTAYDAAGNHSPTRQIIITPDAQPRNTVTAHVIR